MKTKMVGMQLIFSDDDIEFINEMMRRGDYSSRQKFFQAIVDTLKNQNLEIVEYLKNRDKVLGVSFDNLNAGIVKSEVTAPSVQQYRITIFNLKDGGYKEGIGRTFAECFGDAFGYMYSGVKEFNEIVLEKRTDCYVPDECLPDGFVPMTSKDYKESIFLDGRKWNKALRTYRVESEDGKETVEEEGINSESALFLYTGIKWKTPVLISKL